jgi:hypothetical protein
MENKLLKSLKKAERPEEEEQSSSEEELYCFLGEKRNVLHILDKTSLSHYPNQSHDVWSINT